MECEVGVAVLLAQVEYLVNQGRHGEDVGRHGEDGCGGESEAAREGRREKRSGDYRRNKEIGNAAHDRKSSVKCT
jgi:hypothetical protein